MSSYRHGYKDALLVVEDYGTGTVELWRES